MKNILKTFTALLLSTALILTLAAPVWAGKTNDSKIPVVYVEGFSRTIYNTDGQQVFPYVFEDGYITQLAKTLLPVFLKAVAINNYDEYCDTLYELVEPVFSGAKLDNNGENSNGSTIAPWTSAPSRNAVSNGTYDLFAYQFKYDWRLDVCENAEKLNSYIECVKTATHSEKVNIVGRCLGANLVMAYLTAHGDKHDINTCVLYCNVCNGASVISCPMAGEVVLNADALDRTAQDYLGGDYTMELIKATVSLANETGAVNILASGINKIYAKVEENIVPRIMNEMFSTMPGMWSMVRPEDYEQAKALMFGSETASYAGLIKKIDNYHDNVQLKMNETLLQLTQEGMRLCIIAKYGYQMLPFVEDYDEISDRYVIVSDSSFGATAVKAGEVFSSAYLSAADAAGTAKYISPDRQIDASTCLFPDNTWFVKNLTHGEFPDSVNNIMRAAFNSENALTVFDNAEFPQYLVLNEDKSVSPMTDDNMNTDSKTTDVFTAFVNFMKAFFRFIVNWLNTVEIK